MNKTIKIVAGVLVFLILGLAILGISCIANENTYQAVRKFLGLEISQPPEEHNHEEVNVVRENIIQNEDGTYSYDIVIYCTETGEELKRVTFEDQTHIHSLTSVIKNEVYDDAGNLTEYDLSIVCQDCDKELYFTHIKTTVNVIETGEHIHTTTSKENVVESETTLEYDLVTRCVGCGEIISSEHFVETIEPVGVLTNTVWTINENARPLVNGRFNIDFYVNYNGTTINYCQLILQHGSGTVTQNSRSEIQFAYDSNNGLKDYVTIAYGLGPGGYTDIGPNQVTTWKKDYSYYGTIYITGGEDVNNEELISWLNSNATQIIETPQVNNFMLLNQGFNYEEGMTWEEWTKSEYAITADVNLWSIDDNGTVLFGNDEITGEITFKLFNVTASDKINPQTYYFERTSHIATNGTTFEDENLTPFTIGGVEFKAESTMNFEEWVKSDYNTAGFYIKDGFICINDGGSVEAIYFVSEELISEANPELYIGYNQEFKLFAVPLSSEV